AFPDTPAPLHTATLCLRRLSPLWPWGDTDRELADLSAIAATALDRPRCHAPGARRTRLTHCNPLKTRWRRSAQQGPRRVRPRPRGAAFREPARVWPGPGIGPSTPPSVVLERSGHEARLGASAYRGARACAPAMLGAAPIACPWSPCLN